MERKREHQARIRAGDKHVGSPHIWAMSGILDTMMKDARVSQVEAETLKALYERIGTPMDMTDTVKHCTVKTTYRKDAVIVQFRLGGAAETLERELYAS